MLWQDNIAKLLGLQDAIVTNVEVKDGAKLISIEMPRRGHKCPVCEKMTSSIHDYRDQTVKDIPAYGGRVRLLLRKRRYRCECGKRFFENIPFLPRYYRMTNRMASAILDSCADVRSYTSVARQFDVSVSTIIRIFDVVSYPKRELPKVLAIDEFKGNTGGEKFNVILTDPETGEVLDILPKRYAYHLSSYFRTMERKNVQFFVSDMWRTYADTASVYFPSAIQIVDKYHWMRQVIWAFEAVRKEEQKRLGYHYRKCFKHSRKLMLKRFEYLTEEEKVQVNAMLSASARLNSAHFLKERFQAIVDEKSPEKAIQALTQWVFSAENSNLHSFIYCAKTIHNWFPGIANSLRYSYTNAFTEGCNNKIKVLKRNAYGFRNFKRFRNRILHMFSHQNLDKRWHIAA